ncbi:hypothetical protein [Mycolicibacterium sp. CR10]|uniref:hypothetical protein n=1 Tax=Mycolicibacterium sp. CR10 TaxID=2562314 RepID=UPI0010C0AF0D|nr:hypothetical protein [Mycolicibacterium sp. CR10]
MAADLILNPGERLVAASMRLALMADDIEAESGKVAERKSRDRDAYVAQVINELRAMPADAPVWAREFRDSIYPGRRDQIDTALTGARLELVAKVSSRSRALMILIEVVVFQPWSDTLDWRTRAHRRSLHRIANELTPLYETDLEAVERKFAELLRQLQLRSVRFSGYTEKALQAVPQPINDAIVKATTWLAAFWVDDVVVETLRGDLITQLVIIDAEHDEEKAKRVVQSMQEKLAQVVESQRYFTAKLQELDDLRSAFRLLSAENRELRRQLIAERERARMAEAALAVAIDNVFASPLALASGQPEGES